MRQAIGRRTLLWAALLSAAIVFLIVCLLEVFLSDNQKTQINDFTIRSWNRLDELRQRRLLDWLEAYRRWLVSVGILAAIALTAWVEIRTQQRTHSFGTKDIVLACVFFVPSLWIVTWITRATTLFRAAMRATISLVVAYLPLLLLGFFSWVFLPQILSTLAVHPPTLTVAILQLLYLIVYMTSVFSAAIALVLWCPVAIPLALIYFASLLIVGSEFVVRRIAEYPRGTLAAASVILVASIAFLKAIG
jgi:hypothetical protein